MNTQNNPHSQAAINVQRIYVKSSAFESLSVSSDALQNPVQPLVDMQIVKNNHAQENARYQVVLGLEMSAKHLGHLIWTLRLEVAGFYTLEGFSETQQQDLLNGYCMNQLYSYAAVIVTQMVTQGGFLPIYLQPMDFNQHAQNHNREETVLDSKVAVVAQGDSRNKDFLDEVRSALEASKKLPEQCNTLGLETILLCAHMLQKLSVSNSRRMKMA